MKKLLTLLILSPLLALASTSLNAIFQGTSSDGYQGVMAAIAPAGGSSISVGNKADLMTGTGVLTTSYTLGAGTNKILLVGVRTQAGTIASVLDGTTPMVAVPGGPIRFDSSCFYSSLYILVAPPSGTNNIVITAVGYIAAVAVDYSGARQTGQPDAHNAGVVGVGGGATTLTISVSPLTNNDWTVMYAANGTTPSAGSGTFFRQSGESDSSGLFDSNGPLSIPCTSVVAGNWSVGANWVGCGGVGGIPTTTDAPVLAVATTVDQSSCPITVKSISINGPSAQLLFDGVAACTVNLTTSTAATDGVSVIAGCTAPGSGCASGFAIDTSAGSNGNKLTIIATSLASGQSVISNATSLPIDLAYATLQTGAATYSMTYTDNAGTGALTILNTNLIGGLGISVFNIPTLSVQNLTRTGGIGDMLEITHNSQISGACTISNLTDLDPVGDITALYVFITNLGTCNPTGISASGDVAGLYNTSGVTCNAASDPIQANTISYVAVHSYKASPTTSYAVQGCRGTVTFPIAVNHVSSDNVHNSIVAVGYYNGDHNVGRSTAGDQNGQGVYLAFPDGPTTVYTEQYSIAYIYAGNGNIGWFGLNGGSTTAPVLKWGNNTVITNDVGTPTGYQFAENGGTSTQIISPSGIYDSIAHVVSTNPTSWGIVSGNPSNVFAAAGTGGVGASNNDSFNWGLNWAKFGSTGAGTHLHFDNGTTAHPNVIYADLQINPIWPVEVNVGGVGRTFDRCDEIIGSLSAGVGTAEHLFTMIGNQSNGTNGLYTPVLVWSCMYEVYRPQNTALAYVSAGTLSGNAGSFIGAQSVFIQAGAIIQ